MASKKTSRSDLESAFQAVIALHRRGARGTVISDALTNRLDTLVRSVVAEHCKRSSTPLAVVALGAYGRRELCFASDTDILFLLPEDDSKKEGGIIVRRVLHELLDLGLELGHSFRTVDECLSLAETDFESWLALLDARFICGHRPTFSLLLRAMRQRIGRTPAAEFLGNLTLALEARHRKYGTSTKLLEPNIKNSAGGLRDLHSIVWLARGSGEARLAGTSTSTAVNDVLGAPFMRRIFDTRTLREGERALDFLLRTRNEMHLQAKGLHDTLEFSFQPQVAEALGYKSAAQRTSVEQFMQEYYVAARTVDRLTRRTFNWAQETYARPARPTPALVLDKHFAIRNNALELRRVPERFTATHLLIASLHAARHRLPFSPQLEDRIMAHAESIRPIRSARDASLLRELMQQRSGVADALRRLNDLGVLGRLIPEWKPMVAFFQHNVYHYYTADEHTLTVLANAEDLAERTDSFGETFRQLPRRDTLYFACLLHDIAKPKRIGDHEIVGVNIASTVLQRLRCGDIADDVLFLVRNHLLMEQVAFRRNLSDPETILDFAGRFAHARQLDYLYVLTYADLSAVNRSVWTDWKGVLLLELFRKTRDVLEGARTVEMIQQAVQSGHEKAKEAIARSLEAEVPHAETLDHLDSVQSPAYLSTFTAWEIAEHIRLIRSRKPVSALFRHQAGYTEVTVIAQDAPYLLSRCCGVLTANDATILEATIFTRDDGTAIDKFRVSDAIARAALDADQCAKITQELRAVLKGTTDIDQLLQRHRMKWKRRTRRLNPNIRIDVEFERHPRYTIIDVYAFDTLGFLYRITETLSRLGLSIAFAKIATRADGIVDAFYVTDLTGSTVDDPDRRAMIRTELLATIDELKRTELVLV